MLELEEEYLRRHPQRTWQGSGGTEPQPPDIATGLARARDLLDLLRAEVAALQENAHPPEQAGARSPDGWRDETRIWGQVLTHFAEAPAGRLHKLEVHHLARRLAPNARLVAALYRHDPPLLAVDGDFRVLTDAGRDWLVEHPAPRSTR